MKRNFFKWLVSLFVCIAMLFCTTGCNGARNTVDPTATPTPVNTECMVTVVIDGNVSTKTLNKGDNITLEDQTKNGWVFKGYYDGEKQVTFPYTVSGDVTLTVKWEPDELTAGLTVSLKAYLQSEEFSDAVQRANTTQARLPLLYLRYVDSTFYSVDNVVQFKKYLNYINDIIDKGEIVDYKYSSSQVASTGWYGVLDYLYSWSLIYNQYMQWCNESGVTDNSFDIYIPMVERYINKIDTWSSKNANEYEYAGEKFNHANLYYKGYNILNGFGASKLETYNYEWFEGFLKIVAEQTGSTAGHEAFLKAYKKCDEHNDDLRTYGQSVLLPLYNDLMPVTRVAFGYNSYNTLPLVAANLGIKGATPFCDEFMLSYYDKDENGDFIKDGGTPNWVGFSGRPVCGSLYRDNERYDVVFEKTMQGYFPFTDGWSQPLDEMINLDRLCNYYNHTLGTGANVAPQYALMTAMMHGIDMEHYKKEASLTYTDENGKDVIETGDEIFNVITLWRESLSTDEDGNYIINGFTNMAVAIAYLAQVNGIDAPTPLGVYSAEQSVIKLN